jgi:hypothetical protein
MERDTIPPDYAKTLRTLVLNVMHADLTAADATAPWVRQAAADPNASAPAIQRVVDLRYGAKRVVYDPSDPEANALAVTQGYQVIHGGSLSAGEWENVRRTGAALPAGKVTPSPRPFTPGGRRLTVVAEPTEGMRRFVAFVQAVAPLLLDGVAVTVTLVDERAWRFAGCFEHRGTAFHVNVAQVAPDFFDEHASQRQLELVLHELAHHRAANHLSAEYYDELTRLGAVLTRVALRHPDLFADAPPDSAPSNA